MSAPLKNLLEVSNVHYINLVHRTDRNEHVQKELLCVGLSNAQRFNAIRLQDGALGCSMSHYTLLKNAEERGADHVMILEDDITFQDPEMFKKQFNAFMNRRKNDWDVLLLAGNNSPPFATFSGDDSCIKVTRCQTTTGYIVNGSYIKTLKENIREGIDRLIRQPSNRLEFAIDRYWFPLQRSGKWFLLTPPTVIQYPNYSDIENRNTDYSAWMKDITKSKWATNATTTNATTTNATTTNATKTNATKTNATTTNATTTNATKTEIK
jgi:glycosyl transferase, family 25